MATGDIVQRLEVLNGTRDPSDVTPSHGEICKQLDILIAQGGGGGGEGHDGITPTVTITDIAGGHNVAFSYGSGDPRNADFDVMDGMDGTDGTDGTDGQDGQDGQDGSDGADGITPTVTITDITGGHTISFFYAAGDSRNTSLNVMDGVDGTNGTNGTNGTDGTDGITPTVSVTTITGGHNVAFSYGTGDSRNTDFNVLDGTDGTNGTNGQDGYTPVRGTDYWTASDVSSMEAYCAGYIDTQLGTVLAASYPSS